MTLATAYEIQKLELAPDELQRVIEALSFILRKQAGDNDICQLKKTNALITKLKARDQLSKI